MAQSSIGKQTRISYEYKSKNKKKTKRNKILRNLITSLLGDIDNF